MQNVIKYKISRQRNNTHGKIIFQRTEMAQISSPEV